MSSLTDASKDVSVVEFLILRAELGIWSFSLEREVIASRSSIGDLINMSVKLERSVTTK